MQQAHSTARLRVYLCAFVVFVTSLQAPFVFGANEPVAAPAGQGLSPAFMQWCQNFMARHGRTSASCKLACETKNPGAQVYNPIAKQFGSTGFDPNRNRTAIFPSVVHGIAAHIALIRDMCTRGRSDACGGGGGRRPRCTLIELKQVWAPSCHGGNNPSTYANTVAQWVGIQPNQVFNPNDMDQMAKIALASARIEVGFVNYTCEQLAQGTAMAYGKIPPGSVPADVGQMKNLGAQIEGNNSPVGQFLQGFAGPQGNAQGQNPFASPGQWAQQSPQTGGGSSQQSGSPDQGTNPFGQVPPSPYQNPFQPTPVSSPSFVPDDGDAQEDEEDALVTCEDTTVEWSCPSGATLSRGISKPTDNRFKTRGALVGSLTVNPLKKTKYTVQCLKKQSVISESSCVMDRKAVPKPKQDTRDSVLTIDADKLEVQRGKSVLISWAAVGVDSCVIYGEGLSEEGLEGSESTDELYTRGVAQYVLECRTRDGEQLSKSVDVEVR
ncbi:MAG: hypothetical protein RI911_614 [Candidatus Parcubacteria bacterium]